ncbi:MAG TPA: hypothetical protein VNM24_16970 [Burkholderiales bacterium]|jgi:hypothetical protein|nr:hypothetical protein [Burkholderiales bacterium]
MADGTPATSAAHPLADQHAALDLVSALPEDPHQALAGLGAWLEALSSASPELALARRIEIVDLLDRSGRDWLNRLQGEFLAGADRSQSSGDEQAWASATDYLQRLWTAYLDVIRDFQTYCPGWTQVRDKVPTLLARALRATGLRLKWQLLRYAPVDKELWFTLTRLWACAEDRGIAATRVQPYEGVETTLQREFLKPLMLAMSAADSLSPKALDIAERIVAQYSGRFELQRYPSRGCHFFIDLESGAPPSRFVPGMRVRLGMRFFGPGEAVAVLEALSASIASEEAIPAELSLQDVNRVGEVIEVLEHLTRYWWARRPGRTEERKRAVSKILVASGYEQLLNKLSAESAVDLALDDSSETWTVENESESGYGALLPRGAAHWVRVGALLGARAVDSRIWAVGVVRRLVARDDGQRYVGVQLIGRGARVVALLRPAESVPAVAAVLLPSHVGDSVSHGEVTLLLPAGTFSAQATYAMQIYDREYLLEPQLLTESGGDYEIAHFRIAQHG